MEIKRVYIKKYLNYYVNNFNCVLIFYIKKLNHKNIIYIIIYMEESTNVNEELIEQPREVVESKQDNVSETNEDVEKKELDDNSPQFNIIETNIPASLVSKFSSDILVYIFKYSKITGSIDLNSEYENILMSKKINIMRYLNEKLGCRDVYDIKCTGVRIKKIDENVRKKIAQWLLHDEKYYVSFYFYIATPGSLFEAYLLVITGKKYAVATEQFALVEEKQNKTNSLITNIQSQIDESSDRINKQKDSHESLVKELQLTKEDTTKHLTSLKDLHDALVKELQSSNEVTTNKLTTLKEDMTNNLTSLKEETTNKLTLLKEETSNQLSSIKDLHNKLVSDVQINKEESLNQLSSLKNQLVENIETISTKFSNNLNSIQAENETNLHDIKIQLTTNVVDTQTSIKDILSAIDSKIENITQIFKTDINNMVNKFNEDIKNINNNLNIQEINIIKLLDISQGILRSEGDGYVVVK